MGAKSRSGGERPPWGWPTAGAGTTLTCVPIRAGAGPNGDDDELSLERSVRHASRARGALLVHRGGRPGEDGRPDPARGRRLAPDRHGPRAAHDAGAVVLLWRHGGYPERHLDDAAELRRPRSD